MSRYWDTRCRTEQGWGSRSGQDTSAGSGGRGRPGSRRTPGGRGGDQGQQPGVPRLTWLSGPQREALVRVQAQRLAELLDVAGRVPGQNQHHIASHEAVWGRRGWGGTGEGRGAGGRRGRGRESETEVSRPPAAARAPPCPVLPRLRERPPAAQTVAVPSAGAQDAPAPCRVSGPHSIPEPVMSNSIRRTSWKCEGPVTLRLVTMRAGKGRRSDGGP